MRSYLTLGHSRKGYDQRLYKAYNSIYYNIIKQIWMTRFRSTRLVLQACG